MMEWVDQKGNILPIEWFWCRANTAVVCSAQIYGTPSVADVQAPPQPPTTEEIEALRALLIERIQEEAYRLEYDLGMPREAEDARKQIPLVRRMSADEVLEACQTLDLGGA